MLARVLAAVAVAGGSIVAIASDGRAAPSARLTLQDETLVIAANAPLHFSVAVDGAPVDSELVVRVCRNLRPGETMTDAVAGKVDCAALGLYPRVPITSAPITIDWLSYMRKADKPPVTLGQPDPVQLPNTGVYPVQIEVHSGDDDAIIARLVTFVIRPPSPTAAPTVAIAPVFSLPDHTARTPAGTVVVDDAGRAELERLTRLLQARPSDPIAVSVPPGVIAALASSPADATLLADFVSALGNRPLLPRTYDGISLSGTVAAGLHDDLVDELRAGEDALRSVIGRAPDRRTWLLDDTVDDATVATLRDLGATQLLVPGRTLGLADTDTPTGRLSLRTSPSNGLSPDVAAVGSAADVATFAPADPVLAAYRTAAALLADAYQRASRAGSGIVLTAPDNWWAQPADTPETVLGVLARIPQLRVVNLDDWFQLVGTPADGTTATRRLSPRQHPDIAAFARDLATVRSDVVAAASMVPASTLVADTEPRLRSALAAGLTAAEREAYLDAVRSEIGALRNSVQPIPKRTITIAGGETRLPLTLHSTYDEPIQVKLRLTSSKLKFLGNEGFADASGRYEQIVTLPPDTDLRVVIPVESRATNTFPLIVEVLTPSGDAGLVPATELTVRANRLSGLGVALTAGGLVVLATWWAHHLRRNRKLRQSSTSAGRHPSVPRRDDPDAEDESPTEHLDEPPKAGALP